MVLKLISIALVLMASFIGAFGALMLKKGSAHLHRTFKGIFLNYRLILGGMFYGISTVLFIIALKNADLTVLYPLVATTYIWISIFSVRFLGEEMNRWKWLGIGAILIGVTLIGLGS